MVRIAGLVIGTLFWSALAAFIGFAVWDRWTSTVTRHGIDGAAERIGTAAFWAVLVMLVFFAVASLWEWAKRHLNR